MPPGPQETPSETIVHATSVAVAGRAALITGPSGSGKSGLALQLLAMGAELVADDRTRLWRQEMRVIADVPDTIRGQIEARGIGILNCKAVGPTPVIVVIALDEVETDRLPPERQTQLLGLTLPLLRKVENPYFPAAVMQYLKGQA